MKPIEEKFRNNSIIDWLVEKMKKYREDKRKNGQKIKEEDYRRIRHRDLVKIYGMISGVSDDQARYMIDSLVSIVLYLMQNGFTISLGPKSGDNLGEFYFSERKARSSELRRDNGSLIFIDNPRTEKPRFKVSPKLKKVASFCYCPYCEEGEDLVLFTKYQEHLEKVHGISKCREIY